MTKLIDNSDAFAKTVNIVIQCEGITIAIIQTQLSKRISILGAGAFGTSLAIAYSGNYDEVLLYSCFQDHVDTTNKNRINEFLPQFELPGNVSMRLLDKHDTSIADSDYVFWAFPVKVTRDIIGATKNVFAESNVVICSKGILDNGTYLFNLFEDELRGSIISYLAGPNFAIDLASHKVSCANIAARNMDNAKRFAQDLSNNILKLYPTDDVDGIQICSAVKNVIAIACGIISGLQLGHDAHAAIITLGLNELCRLGNALGCKNETFLSFCGIGDMILTSSSELSRNMSLGKSLIDNEPNVCVNNPNATCEGYNTISQLLKIASDNNVSMPVCEMVGKIIRGERTAHNIVDVFAQ